MKKILRFLIIFILILAFIRAYNTFIAQSAPPQPTAVPEPSVETSLKEDEFYFTKEDVALYLHLYRHLPANYLTKKEALDRGWQKKYDYVSQVCEGCVIGGDRFMNREEKLPAGHTYYECDVNYKGKKRNDDRIIYSDDGLIYFSDDHYNTFELLYGDE